MSRGIVLTVTDKLVTEQCCNCGVIFAMPDQLRDEFMQHPNKNFYCPNGHSQHYLDKPEAQKQRERAERLAEQLKRREADLQRERTQHIATKGQLTKARNRVAKGVCPCCNRSFTNLRRHMARQHPDFTESPGLAGNQAPTPQ